MVRTKAKGISPSPQQRTRQAKLEEVAREIREYPLICVASANGSGAFGEIQRLKSGEWEARVFGKEYKSDRATFSDYEQASAWMLLRRDGPTSAGAYDQWFREQVQTSIDDPRPSIPHAQVMAEVQKILDGKADAANEMKRFMDEAPVAGADVDIKKLIEDGRS